MDPLGGLDYLISPGAPVQTLGAPVADPNSLLGLEFSSPLSASYSKPKEKWLDASAAKGLEISGTFSRQQNKIFMNMTLTNRAMQQMGNFAIQFNKNSFGLSPSAPLPTSVLQQNQSTDVSLPLNVNGQIQKMEPLNNLQVAIKNSIGVFYFSTAVPCHVLFMESGEMDSRVFLQTWKDIPSANEKSFLLEGLDSIPNMSTDVLIEKLKRNNVFVIAQRKVEQKDMVYLSLKIMGIELWVLMELKVTPPTATSPTTYNMAYKSKHILISALVHSSIDSIARS